MLNDDKLAERIIGAAMKVHRTLGIGFVEFVYRNSLLHELRKLGLSVEVEKPAKVRYDGIVVGEFNIDLFVEGWLIVELKAARTLAEEHEVQVVNYLTAIGQDFGLLLNFGSKSLQFKRKFRRSKDESLPDLLT